jgi:hypothetical protein
MVTIAIVLFQCSSFSISTGVTYSATNVDKEIAVQEADISCSLREDPENESTCVDDGCRMLGYDSKGLAI